MKRKAESPGLVAAIIVKWSAPRTRISDTPARAFAPSVPAIGARNSGDAVIDVGTAAAGTCTRTFSNFLA